MKRYFILLFTLIFSLSLSTYSQEKKNSQTKLDIFTAYVYQPASLLIGETDLYGSYFITKRVKTDIEITGAEDMVFNKTQYSDGDKMFINKGAKDGIKEGETFLIIAKGNSIYDPVNGKTLGTYFIKKSKAEIYCTYVDKSVVILKDVVHPVNIGNFLIPFPKEETLFKEKISYQSCRLPESGIKGNVVYANVYMENYRQISGDFNYITVDLGKDMIKRGDFLLLYRQIKRKLPPLIIGLGIVIDSQNTNSTVKILDCSFPIQVRDRVIKLEEFTEKQAESPTTTEEIPIVQTLKQETQQLMAEAEQKLDTNIYYPLDSSDVTEAGKVELAKIGEFIKSKSKYAIILRGYTCSIGDIEYNLKLAKERVDKVKELLTKEYGVNEGFIETYYYGEKDAPADNSAEEERQKNRLVSIQAFGK